MTYIRRYGDPRGQNSIQQPYTYGTASPLTKTLTSPPIGSMGGSAEKDVPKPHTSRGSVRRPSCGRQPYTRQAARGLRHSPCAAARVRMLKCSLVIVTLWLIVVLSFMD